MRCDIPAFDSLREALEQFVRDCTMMSVNEIQRETLERLLDHGRGADTLALALAERRRQGAPNG
jgi:uncharacterized protein with von Willebrand factor type A (vWA) domain